MGQVTYPSVRRLLITADGGGTMVIACGYGEGSCKNWRMNCA
jgi:hypothetical protein